MKKLMMVILFTGLLLLLATGSFAGNPLVTNVRTADPNPLVYNNRYYIVCGQDEVNTNTFNMYAWRLLSSTNMRDWTDHGVILRPGDVSWMPDNRAWASSLVYRDGYFYFYASNDWQIGVLRATSITGPYQDVNGRPIINASTPGHAARDIDPMCYIDIDGQAYLFWGGDGNCRYVLLGSDMISLASGVMDVPGLNSYLEAPFVIRENDTYFLMYADSPWPSEIRYATSESIAGPWTYRGVIGTPTGSGTNHEGAAFYKGNWWYTYHTEELSNNNPYSRSVCVDKMYINGNSIQQISYTSNNGGGVANQPSAPPASQDPVWTGGPYTLNGTNDYISLSTGIVNDLYDFTIAVWVNPDTITMWTRVFDFGFNETSSMFLTPSCNTEAVRFVITINGNVVEQRITASSGISTGSWQHLAVTKSGNTGILYVNGSEAARNTGMTLNPADLGSTTNNYIGRSQYADDPYLDGQVDNFYIYNRALDSSEISVLANTAPGATLPPTPTPGPTATPEVLTPGVTYNLQAEDVDISTGMIESDHAGYTGSGYVNYVNESGGYIEWNVFVSSSAQADVVFIYANAGGSSRPCQLRVNNSTAATIDFPDTGEWTTWTNASTTINLSAGSNAIRLTATGSEGGPNVDRMDITVQSSVTSTPTPVPTAPPQDTRGDANGDGSIDIVDALLIAQCYVGLISCPAATIGDTNCDGIIDIVDALLIAQYYVGLIGGFC